MSGDATFAALKQSVDELSGSAPEDHDILIHAFGVSVIDVRYVEPHTFVFRGFNGEGHTTFATCHYSQLVAHIIYIPKRGPARVVTGFSSTPAS